MLGDALVRVELAFWDGGDELVVFGEDELCYFLHVGCDCRGEEHALAVGLFFVREALDDVFEGVKEAHVEQTVGFIKDESVEVAEGVDDSAVAKMVVQSSWGGDQDVTAAQNTSLFAVLVCSTDGEADFVLWEALKESSGFFGDLHGQLSSWGYNEERDA